MSNDFLKQGELVIALPHSRYGITNNGWVGHYSRKTLWEDDAIDVGKNGKFAIRTNTVTPYSENMNPVNFKHFTGIVDDDHMSVYKTEEDYD